MKCSRNEAYELGSLSHAAYREHVATCAICQAIERHDSRLFKLSKSLNQPLPVEGLWEKIEASLEGEQRKQRRSARSVSVWAVAAMLVLGLGLGYYLIGQSDHNNDQRLLTTTLLKRVVETEEDYEQAITQLEEAVEGHFLTMETDLMLLYRDRLETIDTQIERCRVALKTNPANSHIRRYLLAALQDKQETLADMLQQQPEELF